MAKAAATQPKALRRQRGLFPYQKSLVCSSWYGEDGRATTQTLEKARRIGGTTAAGYWAAHLCLGRELREDGTFVQREPVDVWVVSKDFKSSKGLLVECAENIARLAKVDPAYKADPKAESIRFATGKAIHALPCSGAAVRGKTGAIIGDEVAFWRQQEDVWAAAKLVAAPTGKEPRGYPALLITTPWEAGSLAHRLFTSREFPFARHRVDIHDAVGAGFPIDVDKTRAELGIDELFATEYLCQWMRGGGAFFSAEKLRDACRDDLPKDWQSAPTYYGIDVGGGRGRDFTACVQWREIGDELWMCGVRAFNDKPIDEQADELAGWIRGAPGHVNIDHGVMGTSLIDLLRNSLRHARGVSINGVAMMPADQEEYAKAGKRALEGGRLRIYTGDEAGGDEHGARALMLELGALRAKPGTGGRLTFATPRDPSRGHCDRAWAALIGIYEAENPPARILPIPARLANAGRWSGMGDRGF